MARLVRQIPALPPPPDGLVRLPGLRCLLLNAMGGMAMWPLPPCPGALPGLTELQVRNNPALRQMPLYPFMACPQLVRLELAGGAGGWRLWRGLRGLGRFNKGYI